MEKQKIIDCIIVVLPIVIVAVLGTIFTNLGMEWFDGLNKPSQWVPDAVFPIVWSIIYLTFAIYLVVWQLKGQIDKSTIVMLALNGILNIVWCLVFFTLKMTLLGNVVILLNTIASIYLLKNIKQIRGTYPMILILYPLWLCVATTLNLATWILN